MDDPFLRSEKRSCPVQLPLAVSGWGFKDEFSDASIKNEKKEEDCEPMEPAAEGKCLYLCWTQNLFNFLCSIMKLIVTLSSVKQEPEEIEIKKPEATCRPPPLPEPEVLPDLLHRWSLSKVEELFFIQLPDSLPGQPPTKEHKPVKTEVQSEDGQSVLLKTESEVSIQLGSKFKSTMSSCSSE